MIRVATDYLLGISIGPLKTGVSISLHDWLTCPFSAMRLHILCWLALVCLLHILSLRSLVVCGMVVPVALKFRRQIILNVKVSPALQL